MTKGAVTISVEMLEMLPDDLDGFLAFRTPETEIASF